jgi:NAD+ synthase
VLDGGQVATRRAQQHAAAPFDPGPAPGPVALRGYRLGLMLGADATDAAVAETLAETGAELLLALTALPFDRAGPEARIDHAVAQVVETGLGLAWVNLLGGQGAWVFDGGGFVLNPDRALAVQVPGFAPALTVTDWRRQGDVLACAPLPLPPAMAEEERVWQAMMLGLRDAVEKGGARGATLVLRGAPGALVSAMVAVDALGAARVRPLAPPPAPGGGEDALLAEACAASLGLAAATAAPPGGVPALAASLGMPPEAEPKLLALVASEAARQHRHLLLSTLDKAALVQGGEQPWHGYSVVRDAFPALLRRLGRWRQAHHPAGALGPAGPILPEAAFAPPPPLGPDAADLPPPGPEPPVTEAVLQALMEGGQAPQALLAAGHDPRAVWRAQALVRQAGATPPGLTLSAGAIGAHWRYPVGHGFREPIPGTGTPTA